MMSYVVRVLGAVEISTDGRAIRLPAQQTKVLAMLVAAGSGSGVSRSDLLDALWPEAPATDRLSPLISRLRRALAACGLTVSPAQGGRGYRLQSLDGTPLHDMIDAYAYESTAARARDLSTTGDPVAALTEFDRSTRLWSGHPFGPLVDDWTLPRVCRDAQARWIHSRSRTMRAWAITALKHADLRSGPTPDLLDISGHGRTDGSEPDEALWLTALLTTLRGSGLPAAERVLEERRVRHGHDALTARAFHLLELHESGVNVDQADRPPSGPSPDGPLDPATVSRFVQAAAERRGPILSLVGPPGTERAAAVAQLTALAAAAGVRVGQVSGGGPRGLQPWAELVGSLWTAALRDIDVPATRWTGSRASALTAVLEGIEVDTAALIEPLAALLRRAAADAPFVVVVDGVEAMDGPARELWRPVRARLLNCAVAFVIVERSPVDGTGASLHVEFDLSAARTDPLDPDVLDWLAAAEVTALDDDEIPVALVARLLTQDPGTTDRMVAAAADAGAVVVDDGVHLQRGVVAEQLRLHRRGGPEHARLHERAYRLLSADRTVLVRGRHSRTAAHAVAARGLLTGDEVGRALLAAAREQARLGAPHRAVEFAERGVDVATTPGLQFELLVVLGDARQDNGDIGGAESAFVQARTLTDVAVTQRAGALLRLARRWSEPGQLDWELVGLLEQAVSDLGAGKDTEHRAAGLLLRAHLAHKLTHAVIDHRGSGGAEFRRGVTLARGVISELDGPHDFDVDTAQEALLECRWALYDAAAPDELLALAQRAEQAGDPRTRGEAMFAVAVDRLRLGRVSAARSAVETHRLRTEPDGGPLSTWLQQTADTVLDLWHGGFPAAEERLFGAARTLLAELATAGVPHADALQQTWTGQVFWLHRELGRFPELAATGVLTSVERHGYFPVWLAGLALVHAELGRPTDALDQLSALMEETHDLAGLPPHGWAVPTLALMAEACAAIDPAALSAGGRSERARTVTRLLSLLEPHSGEVALAGWPAVLLTPVARSVGLLHLASGHAEAALSSFETAGGSARAARPQLARLRFDTACAYEALGETGRARELLLTAGAGASALGMVLLARTAQVRLDALPLPH